MILHRIILMVGTALCLVSCGGGNAPEAGTATTSSTGATARRAAAALASHGAGPSRPLAAANAADGTSIDPVDAANQVMDFAETYYPDFFPGHPATGSALGYTYRYYEATGIYLGVRDGHVDVLGGPFGSEITPVGPLTQFITPRPRVLSTLCAASGITHDTFVTPAAAVGKNAALTLAGCTGAIGTPQWRQTAGPSVALLSDKSQTLSFDPPEAGTYSFDVSFRDPAGQARTQSVTLTAAPAAAAEARLTVRASQSARMGGKVSVRAWVTLPEGDSVKAVTWMQIEGPTVTLDTRTSRLVLFTAPEVSRDTVVRLRATLHTTNGRSDSDEVLVLVERHLQAAESNENAMWRGEHVPRVYAYQTNGAYSAVLRSCVYDPGQYDWGPNYNLCTLTQLPFLTQEVGNGDPTVEQVMARVLVSHDWLGRNFEAFLRTHDSRGDFRRMLKSVTAIVLSTHIRPSFYFAGTGAIYLDAEDFWLTPEERDTINESPDYRSDFGSALQFADLWRYVQDNRSLFVYYDPRERVTRTQAHLRDEAAWLLYHELAHALDFLPPAAYVSLQRSRSAWDNIAPRYSRSELTSDVAGGLFPLTSAPWRALADVLYRGADATDEQRAYTAQQAAELFIADLATDPYAYSTSREDTAMTLEETLMQRRLGARRDLAITDADTSGTATSASMLVRWGQRGRIGEPALRPRSRFIAQALTPWLAVTEVDLLPAPITMRAGESWRDNLSQPAIPRLARPLNALATPQEIGRFQKELRRMQHVRHAGAKRLPPVHHAH